MEETAKSPEAASAALPATSGDKGKKRCVHLSPSCLCMERTDSFFLVIRAATKPPCYVRRKHQPCLPKCAGFYSSASCEYLSSRAKVGVDRVYSKLFDRLVISIHLATGLSTRATRASRAPAWETSPNGSLCVRKQIQQSTALSNPEREIRSFFKIQSGAMKVCITQPAQLAAERRKP